MINVQGKLPRHITVACSGGVDSMAIVDFLQHNHVIELLFINHYTVASNQASAFVSQYADDNGLVFTEEYIETHNKKPRESQEEFWRNERYRIFAKYDYVVTCHHLDDAVETWIWSSMHGKGKIIPYSNGIVVRPFMLNRKKDFTEWCTRKNVSWVEDQSNADTRYMRNYIRHELVDKLLVVNPGLHKVIKKKVIKQFNEESL